MKTSEDDRKLDRRSVLRGLGLSAAAAPAAAVALGAPAAEAAPADQAASGYRETEHVRRAYAAARF